MQGRGACLRKGFLPGEHGSCPNVQPKAPPEQPPPQFLDISTAMETCTNKYSMAASRFPTEVWDAIIDRIPEAGDTVALPASHATTKSLHAMLLTCKATAKSSTRLLYRHCLYIDSRWRLQALVSSYGNSPALRELKVASSTALYLAPREYWPRSTRDFARLVYSLFETLGEHLRRLFINFPRPSMDSGVGLQQQALLRQAFQKLGVLEEYASVYDFLDFEDFRLHETPQQAISPTWTHLRRLCLYNLTLSGKVI